MVKQRKYQFELKPESAVILSPRAQNAFYMGYDFKEESVKKFFEGKAPKMIYPFYQYGSYEKYNPKKASYYIPGSSIKGALKTDKIQNFLVDDIKLYSSEIELKLLYKLQYIPNEDLEKSSKAMTIEPFYKNVAVETLAAEQNYRGELYYDGNLSEILEKTRKESEKKIRLLLMQIETILSYNNPKEDEEKYKKEESCKQELRVVFQNLNIFLKSIKNMKEKETLLILGGYKGRVLSGIYEECERSSIYIDKSKLLPYGLVRVKGFSDGDLVSIK